MDSQPTTPNDTDRYEVVVVRHGSRESRRSYLYLNYEDYGTPDAPMRIDYYLWVVRNAGTTVLVDLGYSGAAADARSREVLCDPLDAYRELGIDPATFDGDIVITHAHWDHTGHISAFPLARFFIADSEYAFWASEASSPVLFRHLADEADLAALITAHDDGRVERVRADRTLAPGIRLVHGAGHTPGLLMVEVDTAQGGVLLASDAAHFDEEVECDMPFRHMTNLEASYATFTRIRNHDAAVVLAGHEPGVLDRFPRLPGALAAHASIVHALPARPEQN